MSKGWIKVTKDLPHNGEKVFIAVRNKNKEDGIWLFDIAIFYKGEGFIERSGSTWEEVVYWQSIIEPE